VFSSTNIESGSSHNPNGIGRDAYDKPSASPYVYSTPDDYDDIDEMKAGYTELQFLQPKQQATSSDAPEPTSPSPHEYLELLDE